MFYSFFVGYDEECQVTLGFVTYKQCLDEHEYIHCVGQHTNCEYTNHKQLYGWKKIIYFSYKQFIIKESVVKAEQSVASWKINSTVGIV